MSFELLHDLKELIVRVLLVLQAFLELAKIRKGLLLAQRVVRRCLLHRGGGHARLGLRCTRRSPRTRFCLSRRRPTGRCCCGSDTNALDRTETRRERRCARNVRRRRSGECVPRVALSAREPRSGGRVASAPGFRPQSGNVVKYGLFSRHRMRNSLNSCATETAASRQPSELARSSS